MLLEVINYVMVHASNVAGAASASIASRLKNPVQIWI
jgi:hypothetical protein